MDKFDSAIIKQLKINARMSVSAVAEQIGLSRSSVTERIKRLECQGIIKGYQVLLANPEKNEVSAYFFVKHNCASCAELLPYIRDIPEVLRCHGIAGDMDWLVFVQAASMGRIYEIREKLDLLRQVSRVETLVVLSDLI